jgi:O-antigen biosynthesis protein
LRAFWRASQLIVQAVTFWELFFRALPYKPGQALAAAYWHVTRRRVRAQNRIRIASAELPFAYACWIRENESVRELTASASKVIEAWPWQPRFTIMLHGAAASTSEEVMRSLRSVAQQAYPFWNLIKHSVDPVGEAIATGSDYLVPLRMGDTLSRSGLFRLAEALQAKRDPAMLYGDQDELGQSGERSRPWFKPRWNREMFLAQDYLSSAMAIDMALVRQIARKTRNVAELVIEASWTDRPVLHLPYILCHVARRSDDEDRLAALSRKLQPLGARCTDGPFGTIKVEWPLPAKPPVVTIIVPTKDKLDLLRPCIDSVLERTDYQPFEILIVDNASIETRTGDYLASITSNPKVRVLPYPGPYNFSAINNAAAREARGAYLCLLNNDTEVVNPEWLSELMRYAVRKEIGAAGAKLLYENGSIQHAGVVIGIGDAAGHAHRFLRASEPGYFRQPHVTQYVSAVTAACLVVEKKKFDVVGGLDEASLAVAFNDVDLCLKLEKAGWRNVYVPHAVLLHHESRSRGKDSARGNVERYRRELSVLQERWGTKAYADPLHNPNLDRYSESYVLRL